MAAQPGQGDARGGRGQLVVLFGAAATAYVGYGVLAMTAVSSAGLVRAGSDG